MSYELITYKAETGNVGDDFSPWLFERALGKPSPGGTLLFGVGSILTQGFLDSAGPAKGRGIAVFGSGARSPRELPDMTPAWQIYCVRGPLTAQAAGLSTDAYIADPGLLLARILPMPTDTSGPVGIVPYFRSSEMAWQRIADRLGWTLVSPRLSVEAFARKIAGCSRVFCESMHGAIFAESYGIPWRPVAGSSLSGEGKTHAFKWTDWSAAIGVGFDPLPAFAFSESSRGVARRAKERIKTEVMVERLSRADRQDRFVSAEDSVRRDLQDRLLASLDALSRDVTGKGSRLSPGRADAT